MYIGKRPLVQISGIGGLVPPNVHITDQKQVIKTKGNIGAMQFLIFFEEESKKEEKKKEEKKKDIFEGVKMPPTQIPFGR